MATGIGVPKLGEVGRSSLDDRLLTRARYHNLGVVMGCVVGTSTTGMSYSIGTGSDPVSVAVGSRGGADGAVEFPVPSGVVNTTAAPASGSRIDVVWARQLNPDNGDTDNTVVTGVIQGVASTNPVFPSIPAGAVELARVVIPSGATSTSQRTSITKGAQAIPYGASLGTLAKFVDTNNGTIPTSSVRSSLSFSLPTRRKIDITILSSMMPSVSGGTGVAKWTVAVDNVNIATLFQLVDGTSTEYFQLPAELEAGNHTVRFTLARHSGTPPRGLYGLWQGDTFLGGQLQVVDRGVA